MRECIHAVRQVFAGTRAIDERKKYQVIGFLIGMVHLVFTFVFGSLRIGSLFYYNFMVVIYYMLMVVLTGRVRRYTVIFTTMFLEILFHSIMVSVLLGWHWGFMIYTLGLVPFSFYISYTIPYLNKSVVIPAVASLVVSICYFVVRVITNYQAPLLTGSYPENVIEFLYYFNTTLTFVFLWVTAILFSLEIRFMQHNLESENHSLERIAMFDPLTHLLNRRSMNTYLKQAQETAEETKQVFCLIMADIDNFKRVNDTYGHAAGDEVLKQVAQVLSDNVREGENVCRWGGEEMLVLIKADQDTAVYVAERIRKEVEAVVVEQDGVSLSVTLTMGVAQYQPGESVRTMIDRADQRLYKGKHSGKNQVVAQDESG